MTLTWAERSALFISTVGGIGRSPIAPGTVGSLVCLFGVALALHCGVEPEVFLFTFLVLGCVSVPCVDFVLTHPPAYRLKGDSFDPPYIILDEVVGQLLAYVIIMRFYSLNLFMLVCGFLLFRFFDITKPSLIGWVDRRLAQEPKWRAIGIVLDDLLAGTLAGFLVVVGLAIWPFLCRMVKVSWLSAVGS